MRRLTIILFFILISTWSHADPGKRLTREERQLTREERQKARIERTFARKAVGFEERAPDKKQNDRAAMFFLVIGAAMLVGTFGKGPGN